MQKITLKEKVSEFRSALRSIIISEIIKELQRGDLAEDGVPPSIVFEQMLDALISNIINSKSSFDNVVQSNPELKEISGSIDSGTYESENISKLISKLSKQTPQSRRSILSDPTIVDFFIFHESLINLNAVTSTAIKETHAKEDVVIFTLMSEHNPSINLVIEVLKKLQELINLVGKIYEEKQENTIYILDKGSNTNIGVETGVQTAKSLFEIFKEVWDWVINRKFYKQKLRNAAFLDNLGVMNKIEESRKAGAITDEDANRYKELLTKNTNELLSLNTVPRQLLLESNQQTQSQPLLDYNEIRLLKEGEK